MDEIRMTPLVRTYSLQLTETGTLSKGLGVVAKAEQEDDRKQADPNFKNLISRSKLLAESWGTFGSMFDMDSMKYRSGHSVPTIDTLLRAVNDANVEWESHKQTRMGRANERFLRFMNTLNDYSFLFSVVPSNDKYTSLITGVLSSIAKAAAKYQEINEKITHALDRITYDIRQVQKHTKVADTAEVRDLVVEFFVGIFDLLCFIMSWYTSKGKRFIGSFIKSFDKDLNGKVDAVQQTLKKLSEETNLITQSRVYDMHEGLAGISSTTMNTNSRIQNVEAILLGVAARIGLLDVGHAAAQQLNFIQQVSVRERGISSTDVEGYHTAGPASSMIEGTHTIITQFSKSDLLQYSQRLKSFLDDRRDLIPKDDRPTARLVLPREVVGEMQKWMAIPDSKMLWVEGISSFSSEPILSMAALHICSIASTAGILCVSYFCSTPRERRKPAQRDPSLTHTEATCVSLLYSIVAQLCDNLPDDFAGTEEFDHRFQLLDGTLHSSEVALGLIKDLFAYLPPLTVWVLDRFPFAGTKSTTPYIEELIRVLRRQDHGRITKVLYTTEGNTRWLASSLHAGEHFPASRMALNRPGRVMPGAASPLFQGKFQGGEQDLGEGSSK
ncbi:hypothetical protein F5Y10DRAFT_284376 [Nemania abortiva]|nr:hypothetical protein F5Y10DRAFT_284376 [Nemania abortiva]